MVVARPFRASNALRMNDRAVGCPALDAAVPLKFRNVHVPRGRIAAALRSWKDVRTPTRDWRCLAGQVVASVPSGR